MFYLPSFVFLYPFVSAVSLVRKTEDSSIGNLRPTKWLSSLIICTKKYTNQGFMIQVKEGAKKRREGYEGKRRRKEFFKVSKILGKQSFFFSLIICTKD